jgi:hypothetical protein
MGLFQQPARPCSEPPIHESTPLPLSLLKYGQPMEGDRREGQGVRGWFICGRSFCCCCPLTPSTTVGVFPFLKRPLNHCPLHSCVAALSLEFVGVVRALFDSPMRPPLHQKMIDWIWPGLHPLYVLCLSFGISSSTCPWLWASIMTFPTSADSRPWKPPGQPFEDPPSPQGIG